MSQNDFTPIRPRTPRYRTRPLHQGYRRGETRPTPVSYDVDDPARATLDPEDAAPESPWVTLGQRNLITPGPTRHQWPFGPVHGPEWFRQQPGNWDLALNGHSIASQIVPSSTARGTVDPRRAGIDLIARIWSVKQWEISGSLQGLDISGTWAAGNIYSDGTEWSMGAGLGREMAPTRVYVQDFVAGEEYADTNYHLELTYPFGSYGDGGPDGRWQARGPFAAGVDPSGSEIVVAPTIRGVFSVSEDDEEGEAVTDWAVLIQPEPVDGYLVEPLPIYLCGYQLTGHINPDRVGDITGEIHITPVAFWGPDEWP